jgi:hypothetical protein
MRSLGFQHAAHEIFNRMSLRENSIWTTPVAEAALVQLTLRHDLSRLRKNYRHVIPKGGVCPRNLLFL